MNTAPWKFTARLLRIAGVALFGLMGMIVCLARPALADPPAPSTGDEPIAPSAVLSSYWHPAVLRWEPFILEEANRRGIDPDFIAAVIWTESLGRPNLHSPAGAVGLMGVMPKEKGFSWRPSAQELEDPALNVFWGTRTLSIVIRQARRDLYLALAAYNGGWEQIQFPGPRRYAEDTLMHYARAVAVRMGLPAEGPWVITLAAVDPRVRTGLTVLGPQFPLTRYSARPVVLRLEEGEVDGRPTALVFDPRSEEDLNWDIGLWLWWNRQVLRPSTGGLVAARDTDIASSR